MGVSEVARIKEEITTAYASAKLGLSGLAFGTARHDFILARQERIAVLHEDLQQVVGEQEAIQVVVEALDQVPTTATRDQVLDVVRYELGDSQETEILIDWILDMWETIDLLMQRFGDQAHKIISVSASAPLDSSSSPPEKGVIEV
jgi:hypothetical protein